MASTLDAFKLYVDSHDASLFEGVDLSKDAYLSQFAYYTGPRGPTVTKDYATAIKYARSARKAPTTTFSATPTTLR